MQGQHSKLKGSKTNSTKFSYEKYKQKYPDSMLKLGGKDKDTAADKGEVRKSLFTSSPLTNRNITPNNENYEASSSQLENDDDFFAQAAPTQNDSSIFGEEHLATTDTKSIMLEKVTGIPTSSKRLSQSFTPSQPERFNHSLSFWKTEEPVASTSAQDFSVLQGGDQLSRSKFGIGSLVEGDSSPYLMDHDVPSDIASADHTFESNGTRSKTNNEKSHAHVIGGMVGDVSYAEPTGFSFTSNMLLDHHDVPDAAAVATITTSFALTNNQAATDDVSPKSNRLLNDSLLEQVMPSFADSPLSSSSPYRPSPLAKYVSPSAPVYSSSPSYRSTAASASGSGGSFSSASSSSPSLKLYGSATPSTPANQESQHQSSAAITTTPVDVLKRRLDRSEETLHQYEQDLVRLQANVTKLEESNAILRKDLEDEKKRVVTEENEAYELEQDRDLYKEESEGLRKEVDELMAALKIRDRAEIEHTTELSETIIKLESSHRNCSLLEEKIVELTRQNTEIKNAQQDGAVKWMQQLHESQQKCKELESLVEKIKLEMSLKPSATSIETQSDFPVYVQESKPLKTTDSAVQTEEDVGPVSSTTAEDLSAFIVNKDESIFNNEQLERELEVHDDQQELADKFKLDKLTKIVEQNELKMIEVKSSLEDIHSKTMQVRQDLVVKSHFGKEVERWVDDVKSSVQSAETYILDARQALEKEKRRTERLHELVGHKEESSQYCQTDTPCSTSQYVQTKSNSIFLNAGIQTVGPNMADQDVQTDEAAKDAVAALDEEDSLQFLMKARMENESSLVLSSLKRSEVVMKDTGTQTMLLFDLMDPDYASRRRRSIQSTDKSSANSLYASNSFTANLVQLFITLLCLLVGYLLYNVMELFGFLRSALRIAKESKIALI